MPSKRTVQSKWSTRLGVSSPGDGSTVVVRKVQFFKKIVDWPSPKKRDCFSGYTLIPHNYLQGVDTNTFTSNLHIWSRNFLFYVKLVFLSFIILKAVVIQLYPLYCFTHFIPIFFSLALRPNADHGLLSHEVSTTVGRTALDEWSARRRDLYLTTHNTHNRETSMTPVGFEPTIWAGERPQMYALDRAATETGVYQI